MKNIQLQHTGRVGYITLDRPGALNSLTLDMIRDIHAAISRFENNPGVEVIVIRSSSERAFCAGGDMKATREMVINDQWEAYRDFFEVEYALNLHISQCSKPYISLVSGIAMGGGLGLTVHGAVMVVCETTRVAMPETAIGFFPDVGGTHFLSRLPYDAGLWLGLTGMPVKGSEAVSVGLASHYVPSDKWSKLTQSLENFGGDAVSAVLADLAETPDDKEFTQVLRQRQEWFSGTSDVVLIDTLTEASKQHEDARQLLKRLMSVSPYAVSVSRRLLAEAKPLDLEHCLQLEFANVETVARHPDFVEGIRAVLVDKDKPQWQSRYGED